MSEFYEPPVVDLGDPATDLPLTMRRHPDDNPLEPGARRVLKVDAGLAFPWIIVTGRARDLAGCNEWDDYEWFSDESVASWPYTSHTQAGAAFLPQDPHRTFKFDGIQGVAECSCGVLEFSLRDRTHAGHWHATHRKRRAQPTGRGDMDVHAFKGGTS